MAWETIENVKPKKPSTAAPAHGVTVTSRSACKATRRYINLAIGAELARAVRFCQDAQKIRLLFGSGDDAGKVGVVMDMTGDFVAKKQKNGSYRLTIGAESAEGLFSLDFPAFSIERCEAIRPENGKPPMFTFKASPAMLEVPD